MVFHTLPLEEKIAGMWKVLKNEMVITYYSKHIADVYPAELHQNKTKSYHKENFFLGFDFKVNKYDIHTSVYDKRKEFGFPIVNSPWLNGDIPRHTCYGIFI